MVICMGGDLYPWFEFGAIAEMGQDRHDTGISPRSSKSRLSTEEDRCRAVPDEAERRYDEDYAGKMAVFEQD